MNLLVTSKLSGQRMQNRAGRERKEKGLAELLVGPSVSLIVR